MSTDVRFDLARIQVRAFSDETDLVKEHFEAMEYWECQAFLQTGLAAFRWIETVDAYFQCSETSDEVHSQHELDELVQLCEEWLRSYRLTDRWISTIEGRGFRLAHLEEFRCAYDDVENRLRVLRLASSGELHGMDLASVPVRVSNQQAAAIEALMNRPPVTACAKVERLPEE